MPQLTADNIEAQLKAALSAPPPTRLSPSHYKPKPQPFYVYDDAKSTWIEETASDAAASTTSGSPSTQGEPKGDSFRLLTWNIDCLIPFGEQRMAAALAYLETLIGKSTTTSTTTGSNSSSNDRIPAVIFFQEMTPDDLALIQAAPWIQQHFYLTERDNTNWGTPYYGTVTLVDRKLSIAEVFRIPFVTRFGRDGFYVSIRLASSNSDGEDGGGDGGGSGALPSSSSGFVLQLCNAHLESLIADPPIRPLQLEDAAKQLHAVRAGLVAGDLNAIQPFDRTIAEENNLKDVYLELGGKEDSDEGYTWGIQVPEWLRKKFGPSRMDKVLYCGALQAVRIERIGVGVTVTDEEVKKEMREKGIGEWVTDHYGLMAEMRLVGARFGG